MPSYLKLQSEQVWWDQFVPPNLTSLLIEPLRVFYNLSGGAVGAAGDNNHTYGRHRSANWDLTSAYSTDRSYGTTNSKDKQGDLDWYRAVDVGIQGQALWDASRRLDKAVRAGKAPAIAEWFGTFDGQTVVGWFEGHSSSSDSSHLWHLHVGLWNQYANDPDALRQIFGIITGTAPLQKRGVQDMLIVARSGEGATARYWVGNGFVHREIDEDAALRLTGGMKYFGAPTDGPFACQVLSWGNTAPEFVWKVVGETSWADYIASGGGTGGGLTFAQAVEAAEQGANLAEDS